MKLDPKTITSWWPVGCSRNVGPDLSLRNATYGSVTQAIDFSYGYLRVAFFNKLADFYYLRLFELRVALNFAMRMAHRAFGVVVVFLAGKVLKILQPIVVANEVLMVYVTRKSRAKKYQSDKFMNKPYTMAGFLIQINEGVPAGLADRNFQQTPNLRTLSWSNSHDATKIANRIARANKNRFPDFTHERSISGINQNV